MEKWLSISDKYINEKLLRITMSNPRQSDGIKKIQVRPILLKGQLLFQASTYKGAQVFHSNLTDAELKDQILVWMQDLKQFELEHAQGKVTMLVSKKGKVTLKEQKNSSQTPVPQDLSHNRAKKYILDPDVKVPFLVELGVQTKEGKIVRSRYDKFRQINRFLEFIRDIVPELPKNRQLTILDFGCGKSYLTFAMYYYLKILCGLDIRIIGLDLKEDVIDHCNQLAESYGYDQLTFLKGDIADYEGVKQVDMVVTLHACDTATDYALERAVRWGASVILSVPCCQHELNKQMESELLQPILKYGLIKERMAALFTDALRANALEEAGYKVQILEFIDMEHTPKNILIRGVKDKKRIKISQLEKASQAVKGGQEAGKLEDGKIKENGTQELMDFLHVNPTLYRLINS